MYLCESTAFFTACSTLSSVGKFPNIVGSPEENVEIEKKDQHLWTITILQQKWLNKCFATDAYVKAKWKCMTKCSDALCIFYSSNFVSRYY